MPTVWTEVEVDVELSEFEDEDLIEELERRGMNPPSSVSEIIGQMHDAYTLKQKQRVDELLRELFYQGLGRIV